MLRRLKKLLGLKERTHAVDSFRVWAAGTLFAHAPLCVMQMPDGSPVSVETVMREYRVDQYRAEDIVRRRRS